MITLEQFIIQQQQRDYPYAKGDFSRLLCDIAIAAKVVNREVNKAGLAEIIGKHGHTNVQGEEQQKLDVFADRQFMAALKKGRSCCYIASEEQEYGVPLYDEDAAAAQTSVYAPYIVCIDPLDGSSNIDSNVSVGTIFSIYRRLHQQGPVCQEEVLQQGRAQIAAGYIIYGSSTMLVFTTGCGVNGFTLDPSIGEFCLSHPAMQLQARGSQYSVNEGHTLTFPDYIKRYLAYCHQDDPASNRPYSSRYIGSMVADIHRILIQGGIFMYPPTAKNPQGKLRLMYECNPMAWIVEQAGGKASTGSLPILDVIPQALHQRVPILIGSPQMVDDLISFQELGDALSTQR